MNLQLAVTYDQQLPIHTGLFSGTGHKWSSQLHWHFLLRKETIPYCYTELMLISGLDLDQVKVLKVISSKVIAQITILYTVLVNIFTYLQNHTIEQVLYLDIKCHKQAFNKITVIQWQRI